MKDVYMDPGELRDDARASIEGTPLFEACINAGKVCNAAGHRASARQMVEVTRAIHNLGGWHNFITFAQCFSDVDGTLKNSYTPYLTRLLADNGIEVVSAHSKLDGIVQ